MTTGGKTRSIWIYRMFRINSFFILSIHVKFLPVNVRSLFYLPLNFKVNKFCKILFANSISFLPT